MENCVLNKMLENICEFADADGSIIHEAVGLYICRKDYCPSQAHYAGMRYCLIELERHKENKIPTLE